MNKKILLLLLMIGVFSLFGNVWAIEDGDISKEYQIILEDDASLLSEEDKTQLTSEMDSLKKYGNVIFKSILENEGTTEDFAKSYYVDKFGEDNGIIILFDMANSYLYLYTDGENYKEMTDDDAQRIVDDSVEYAKNQEYYRSASTAYTEVREFLEKETIEVENNNFKIVIEDDANLLKADEMEKLKEDMKPLTKYGNIAFKSISENSKSASDYARDYYHNKFGTESGTLFLIDMDNRKIYIFSDGDNYKVITNSKAEIITDNIYTYASVKAYYKCASLAYSQMYTILEGGKIAEPMRHISNIVVSLVIAFFMTFIYVFQKTKIKKASGGAIIKNCDVSFGVSNISGYKSGTHSVYSPVSDSSSSSSSGGGGGGGGGSSGGGGGHSF